MLQYKPLFHCTKVDFHYYTQLLAMNVHIHNSINKALWGSRTVDNSLSLHATISHHNSLHGITVQLEKNSVHTGSWYTESFTWIDCGYLIVLTICINPCIQYWLP